MPPIIIFLRIIVIGVRNFHVPHVHIQSCIPVSIDSCNNDSIVVYIEEKHCVEVSILIYAVSLSCACRTLRREHSWSQSMYAPSRCRLPRESNACRPCITRKLWKHTISPEILPEYTAAVCTVSHLKRVLPPAILCRMQYLSWLSMASNFIIAR